MSDIDVKAHVDQLRRLLPYVPPVSVDEIKALHQKGDFGAVVKLIRSTMNVGVNLTIHWTSGPPPKGLERAKAWISLLEKMPYYGTPEFKELKMDIFILKSFRDTSTYGQFAITVAHELSHVVLESISHPLRKEEKAVDLTAMLLGFSYLYRTTAHTVRRVGHNEFQRSQLGYLSHDELDAACKLLLPAPKRTRHAVLNYARASAGLIVLLCILLSAWAVPTLSKEWRLHQVVADEESNLKNQIPIHFGQFETLTAVQAGFTSLTRTFRLAVSPEDPMTVNQLTEFETIVRTDLCATEARNIGKGISYVNEYWDAQGHFITRFEISSCL